MRLLTRRLRFREDQTFKIVQFTDVHWNDVFNKNQKIVKSAEEGNTRSRELMQRVISLEQPDLIVFTGDVISAYSCEDPLRSFRLAVSAAEESGIPWAVVFGNHDTEAKITREQLMDCVLEHQGTVTSAGPADLPGCGNYVLEIGDAAGRTAAALYFLDSGNESAVPGVRGYDWIRREQVNWYVEQSRRLKAANGGSTLPALAFFHIPLPEYQLLWDHGHCVGSKYEQVCCPPVNSGLHAAMVEMGDVMGTFVGHDHVNDFEGEWHGIRLCYGRASGFNTYGLSWFPRGARVIQLTEGERSFDTWIRLEDGSLLRNTERITQEA